MLSNKYIKRRNIIKYWQNRNCFQIFGKQWLNGQRLNFYQCLLLTYFKLFPAIFQALGSAAYGAFSPLYGNQVGYWFPGAAATPYQLPPPTPGFPLAPIQGVQGYSYQGQYAGYQFMG